MCRLPLRFPRARYVHVYMYNVRFRISRISIKLSGYFSSFRPSKELSTASEQRHEFNPKYLGCDPGFAGGRGSKIRQTDEEKNLLVIRRNNCPHQRHGDRSHSEEIGGHGPQSQGLARHRGLARWATHGRKVP